MILFIIKNKVLILIAIIILLIISMSGITYLYKVARDESNRHEQNYKVSESDIMRFKTKKGEDAVFIQEQQVTIRELKHSNDSAKLALFNQAKDLKIKDKEIDQLISVKAKIEFRDIFIPIHDTIILREGKPTIKRIAPISTKWVTASIAVFPDTLEILHCIIPSELTLIGHRFKTRWFIFRWFESWKYSVSATFTNPYIEITDIINIKITNKRGR